MTFCVFIIWLAFFDKNNFFAIRQLKQSIHNIEQEGEFYRSELQGLDDQMRSIEEEQERYAREQFYLHKDNEIVYIIK